MTDFKKFDFQEIKRHAQELRTNLTDSEKVLWKELRGRKLSGYKFLRQHPILYKGNLVRFNYFIADFYCNEKKVVIELDGPIHDVNEEYDTFRDSELQNLGIRILRIKNEELINMDEVLQKIKVFMDSMINNK
ncbi:MAG: endonuclease domain-containing protein [Bacteroidales bacterium]|nr:endonuclease domain-containing protein [Bacteroidales bacterium]